VNQLRRSELLRGLADEQPGEHLVHDPWPTIALGDNAEPLDEALEMGLSRSAYADCGLRHPLLDLDKSTVLGGPVWILWRRPGELARSCREASRADGPAVGRHHPRRVAGGRPTKRQAHAT
jgi:hypothetical protein